MSYHDKMHELIYSELQSKGSDALLNESTIFMPTIFEINCQSILIHDFDPDKKAIDEHYGFSYSMISNQFLLDSLPEQELVKR